MHNRSIIFLVAAASFVEAQQLPPTNPSVSTIVSEISAQRIKSDVATLVGFGTRHTLSDTVSPRRGIGAARRWIASQFTSISKVNGNRLKVDLVASTVPISQRVPRPVNVVDVVATLPGSASPERVFIVSGHYDSRASRANDDSSDAPGANDDGSGTALVLELARIMSKHQFNATIKFVAFAGEEQVLLGANVLASLARERQWNVEGVFNNDIVGGIQSGDGSVESTYVRIFSEAYAPVDTGAAFRSRNAQGLENDGPSRSLARFVNDAARRYVPSFGTSLIYRRDRFLRGGDHAPFHERGFAAIRFSVVKENYDWQHQSVRTENGKQFGDLLEFVNADYCANVARVNAAALSEAAFAPTSPVNVHISARELGYGTVLQWNAVQGAAGYEVRWRETSSASWGGVLFCSDTSATLSQSKDDYIFAVQSVGMKGSRSIPAVAVPGRN